MDTKRRYSIINIKAGVYVNNLGHPHVEYTFDWAGKRRTGQLCVPFDDITMLPGTRYERATVVTKYPRYLKDDMYLPLYMAAISGKLWFYEYDRDGNRRTENLRYHDENSYYALVRTVARHVANVDPVRMASIFNSHVAVDTVMATTSADGGLVKIIRPAHCVDYESHTEAKVTVHRLDTDQRDVWSLSFIAPTYAPYKRPAQLKLL